MKLAEALLTRADILGRIDALHSRLRDNAIVQEGEESAEDPCELLGELDALESELERLITAINLTNAAIERDGVTLTAMLARRDCLKQRMAITRDFLSGASSTGQRARGSEIKLRPTVPVREPQKRADAQAAELRRLELTIQELNWTSDLI